MVGTKEQDIETSKIKKQNQKQKQSHKSYTWVESKKRGINKQVFTTKWAKVSVNTTQKMEKHGKKISKKNLAASGM